MTMLRSLDRAGDLDDAVHIHSARSADGVIFAQHLRDLDERHGGYHLHLQLTGERGGSPRPTSTPSAPTGASGRPSLSGPAEMLDALVDHWDARATRSCWRWSASSR